MELRLRGTKSGTMREIKVCVLGNTGVCDLFKSKCVANAPKRCETGEEGGRVVVKLARSGQADAWHCSAQQLS